LLSWVFFLIRRLSENLPGQSQLEIAPAPLLQFDGFEQRLEIAFTKALAARTLDDLQKQRRSVLHRLGEDLQEVAVLVSVYKDIIFTYQFPVFFNLSNPVPDSVVIALRNGEKFESVPSELSDCGQDIRSVKGDMLYTGGVVEVDVLLNLALSLSRSRFVDGKLDVSSIVGHDFGA
jgi:hypothetical protein